MPQDESPEDGRALESLPWTSVQSHSYKWTYKKETIVRIRYIHYNHPKKAEKKKKIIPFANHCEYLVYFLTDFFF